MWVVCLLMLTAGDMWGGEDVGVLRERLHRANLLTSINTEGFQPWHLKLHVQSLGGEGMAPGEGSIEEWWLNPKVYRVVYATPTFKGSVLRNADGLYRSTGSGPEDSDMRMLLREAVHPMPTTEELDNGSLTMKTETFSGVKLDCIMLGQTIRGVDDLPLGLFPTYCLGSGADTLRLSFDFGGLSVVRNKLGKFLDREVALEEGISSNGKLLMRTHVEILKTEPLTVADFAPGPDMQNMDDSAAEVASGVMAAAIITKVNPIYPEEAKMKHLSGAVTLKATIGSDGRVHSLRAISYPDGAMAISAIRAVRMWRYKPYLLNGEPRQVETTITVNYRIGSG